VFESVFGEARALRDWFSELILYSQTLTLTGCYRPFNELAAAVLRMRGEVTGVAVSDADVADDGVHRVVRAATVEDQVVEILLPAPLRELDQNRQTRSK
jgi:hypothetical protein